MQEDYKLKASLGYRANSKPDNCLKMRNKERSRDVAQ